MEEIFCACDAFLEGVIDWEWTPGWGNLFTVLVAAAAIGVSAWYNRRTLRSTDEKFVQGRIDARTDKLRQAVAGLVSDIEEFKQQSQVFWTRIVLLARSAPPNAEPDRDSWFRLRAPAIRAETVAGVQHSLLTHAQMVLMLTNDVRIIEPVYRIIGCLQQESRDIKATVALQEPRLSELLAEDDDAFTERRKANEGALFQAVLDLGIYCSLKFQVRLGP
ncbi:hypothetical protein [Mycobacterium marseillense]|uniref:Uncharacterized protein n=1 Tax=Mycobacterium marseillense TaxID=701042 RepID=A0AAC9YMC8_9MYCO|nr:hypothetical protein [Mycobacterium marseillense]ASW91972.1 hypothetical protein CKJ54_20405 [Mycobacterium marseillense]